MTRRRYKRKKSSSLTPLILLILLYILTQADIQKITAYLAIAAAVAIIIIILYKLHKRSILLSSGMHIIDQMSGKKFEEFLQAYFNKQGYKAHLTPVTNDYGADLVIEKKGIKTVIQAKRWKYNVGIEAVQQVIGAINYYKADYGIVITNSYFTQQAVNLAESNDIELWDRDKLIGLFSKNQGRETAMESIYNKGEGHMHETDRYSGICPECGSRLVVRNSKRGRFWGCTSYPACRYTRNIDE